MEEIVAIAVLFMLGGTSRRRSDAPSGSSGASTDRDVFGVPYASSSSTPSWPVDGASSRPVTADFGDGRPYGSSSPTRHHCGEDLPAPRGTMLVAVESGRVVYFDRDWYKGNGALLLQLDSGIVVNYGEIDSSSLLAKVGTRVARGQALARSGTTNHVHFETYRSGTRRTYQWAWGGKPPAALLDPTRYLRAAAGS